jgi:hypothetical protein
MTDRDPVERDLEREQAEELREERSETERR